MIPSIGAIISTLIEFIVPKAMSDPMTAISPMARGRLESSARAFLGTLLTKRQTEGDEEEGEELAPRPSSVVTRPKSTIFFFGLGFCLVPPWLHRIRMERRRWDLRGEVKWVLRGFSAGDIGEIRWRRSF